MSKYKNPIPSVDFPESVKRHDVEFDEDDYMVKESVYFAFIDVLGFKKVFDDNRKRKSDVVDGKFSNKFKEVFKYYFNLMNSAKFSIPHKSLCYAGQTSDSLYFYTDNEYILIDFIKIFSHFNVYAMAQDVFFRGGIAKGNLFFKKDYQFYGESVIYAYLLESEICKNPIVMIDENTYKAIAFSLDGEKLVKEKNGRYYIPPFAYLEHKFELNIDEPSIKVREIDEKLLEETIMQNKSNFEYDVRNYDKYLFLINEYYEYKQNTGIK